MSLRLRLLVIALLVTVVAVGGLLFSGGLGSVVVAPVVSPTAGTSTGPGASPDGTSTIEPTIEPTLAPTPTPRPDVGGTELYGYVPYWQMTASMATHLRSTPLTTIALFSVTARRNGSLNTGATGYRRIIGTIGRQLIADAHARRTRVELVFTSFGGGKNTTFLGGGGITPSASPGASGSPGPGASAGASAATPLPASTPGATAAPPPWRRTVRELVALAVDLGVNGINVDIEAMNEEDRPGYGEFLAALRAALVKAIPDARLSVATEAGRRGVGNAPVAIAAGADRLFLMGYDYHWSGSQPGASSPVDRTDGLYTLRWSIDRYVEAGVPRDRILLGLPLYGMRWRLAAPGRTAEVIGAGVTWIPNQHLDVLLDPKFHPGRDIVEISQVVWEPDGAEWIVTFYDSPATLRPKLALALDNGLAGAGFWAMGYERGIPGFKELMTDFRSGGITRDEAPPRPTPGP
jgi:hypothetical protein